MILTHYFYRPSNNSLLLREVLLKTIIAYVLGGFGIKEGYRIRYFQLVSIYLENYVARP